MDDVYKAITLTATLIRHNQSLNVPNVWSNHRRDCMYMHSKPFIYSQLVFLFATLSYITCLKRML